MKLQKVTGSRPERSYVLGSKVATLPPKLIVEATQKMSKKSTAGSLEKENLSKPSCANNTREIRVQAGHTTPRKTYQGLNSSTRLSNTFGKGCNPTLGKGCLEKAVAQLTFQKGYRQNNI